MLTLLNFKLLTNWSGAFESGETYFSSSARNVHIIIIILCALCHFCDSHLFPKSMAAILK